MRDRSSAAGSTSGVVGLKRDPLTKLRGVVADGEWVALDTETTELGREAELVELAIIEPSGAEFQTLIRPERAISPEARQVHGIQSADLAQAPPFAEVAATVRQRLARRTILCYHAEFDRRVLWRAFALAVQPAPRSRWLCVCDIVTEWRGSRLTLSEALALVGLAHRGRPHRAAVDARAVAELVKALAHQE